jgi:transcriptional regulator with XRE-family HTH domain
MILLRRVIGDALRARRQAQHRTLREVSTAANVSLGYLSEIERGQKEASSELLAAVCDALGARLSEVLREVSSSVATTEQREGGLPALVEEPVAVPEQREAQPPAATEPTAVSTLVDGDVTVTVRQDGPLSTRLTARTIRRDVLTGV